MTATLATQSVNTIFAGPSSGSVAAAPTFRSAVPADLAASGTAYQVLGITSAGTGFEYKTLTAGTGIAVTLAAGLLTVSNTGVTNVGLALPNIFTISGSPVSTTGTLTAVLATQTQNLMFASPNGSSGLPTFRAMVAADLPATAAKTYRQSFTNGSLTAGVVTVSHSLNNQYVACHVYDNNNKRIDPDDITCTSTSALTVDVSSWGTLTGTFNAVVIG